MGEPKPYRPAFDIRIGTNAQEVSVRLNDVDITRHLEGIGVDVMRGGLTKVRLHVRRGDAQTCVQRAIDRSDVELVEAPDPAPPPPPREQDPGRDIRENRPE